MEFERNPTQFDVSWFIDLEKNQRLNLDPPYQRKSVWNKKDQEFFIDTVLNGFPCPAIFLYKHISDNGDFVYNVIDGKQRLKTVLDFSKDEFPAGKEEVSASFRGRLFSQLGTDQKKIFWNYAFPVELVNTDHEEIIRSIFDRLNRNNKNLNRQELRNARFDGALRKFIDKELEDNFWGEMVRFTKRDVSRMIDQQFISEIVMLLLTKQPQGFDQDKLDELYALNDTEFEEETIVAEKLSFLKSIIRKLSPIVIRNTYGTRANFYTLISCLNSLEQEQLSDVNPLSSRLADFAARVKASEGEEEHELVQQYRENSRGASTDLKQRKSRHEALRDFLLE